MKTHSSPCSLGSLLALIGAAVFLSPLPFASAADTVNAKTLQGIWTGARFDSGKGEDPSKGVKLQLIFEGDSVKGLRLPQGDIGDGKFTVSADGKTIDATGNSGGFKGNLYLGIIKVDGDTLSWCTTAGHGGKTQKRPTEFAANPAQATYLIVVKRQAP